MEHKCDKEKEMARLANENLVQQTQIDERVKWTMFWAILLSVFSVLSMVILNIFSQLDEDKVTMLANTRAIENKIGEAQIAQAKIDVQYVEIQKQLAEIKIQLSKIK